MGGVVAVGAVVHIVKIVAELHIVQLPTKTWQPGEIRLCELMYGTISRTRVAGNERFTSWGQSWGLWAPDDWKYYIVNPRGIVAFGHRTVL